MSEANSVMSEANTTKILSALLLCLVCNGCASSLDIFSPSALGDGVSGKSWQTTAAFVDTSLYLPPTAPAALTQQNVMDFDAAAWGTQAQVVGSWWDTSTTNTYRGYARLYDDSAGWAALGSSEFGQIGFDLTDSFSFASVGAGPGGLFMANFMGTTVGASAYFTGSSWLLATNNAALTHVPVSGTRVVSALDSLNRGFVFMQDSSSVAWEAPWSQADATGIDNSSFNKISAADTLASNSAITARYDGGGQLCATYEASTGALHSNCQNVTCGGSAFTFSSDEQIITATEVAGHDTATDGAGNIMAVFYKGSSTSYKVYASLGTMSGSCTTSTAETWSTPVQLDAAATSAGYKAPWVDTTLWPNGTRPGVAYVGSGRFLAVWIAVAPSSSPLTVASQSVLYSALYDPSTGWQTAQQVPYTGDTYNSTPHPQSLTVFGNGDDNGGYALNTIYTTDTIPGATVQPSSSFPESSHVRVTQANRWQVDNGWLVPHTYTDAPCFSLYSGTGQALDGDLKGCAHVPAAAILSSGTTVVFFVSEDGYSSGTLPGNLRLSEALFK